MGPWFPNVELVFLRSLGFKLAMFNFWRNRLLMTSSALCRVRLCNKIWANYLIENIYPTPPSSSIKILNIPFLIFSFELSLIDISHIPFSNYMHPAPTRLLHLCTSSATNYTTYLVACLHMWVYVCMHWYHFKTHFIYLRITPCLRKSFGYYLFRTKW